MKYLLDTCIISELVSKQPSPKVILWISEQEEQKLFLSVVTLGEIRKGIQRLPLSSKRSKLEIWVSEDLRMRFDRRILDLDANVLDQWGILMAALEKKGKKMPIMDSLIAATVLIHRLTLVTANEADFLATGIQVLNPDR